MEELEGVGDGDWGLDNGGGGDGDAERDGTGKNEVSGRSEVGRTSITGAGAGDESRVEGPEVDAAEGTRLRDWGTSKRRVGEWRESEGETESDRKEGLGRESGPSGEGAWEVGRRGT